MWGGNDLLERRRGTQLLVLNSDPTMPCASSLLVLEQERRIRSLSPWASSVKRTSLISLWAVRGLDRIVWIPPVASGKEEQHPGTSDALSVKSYSLKVFRIQKRKIKAS